MAKSIYNSPRYKLWRKKVFVRDDFTCQMCGNKGSIQAHHIKRKADHKDLTFIVKNGITLCVKCHNVVTGRERLFVILFNKIVSKSLTLDYLYGFFARLVKQHKGIVRQFKTKDKWIKIPDMLVQHIKKNKSLKANYDSSKSHI